MWETNWIKLNVSVRQSNEQWKCCHQLFYLEGHTFGTMDWQIDMLFVYYSDSIFHSPVLFWSMFYQFFLLLQEYLCYGQSHLTPNNYGAPAIDIWTPRPHISDIRAIQHPKNTSWVSKTSAIHLPDIRNFMVTWNLFSPYYEKNH